MPLKFRDPILSSQNRIRSGKLFIKGFMSWTQSLKREQNRKKDIQMYLVRWCGGIVIVLAVVEVLGGLRMFAVVVIAVVNVVVIVDVFVDIVVAVVLDVAVAVVVDVAVAVVVVVVAASVVVAAAVAVAAVAAVAVVALAAAVAVFPCSCHICPSCGCCGCCS